MHGARDLSRAGRRSTSRASAPASPTPSGFPPAPWPTRFARAPPPPSGPPPGCGVAIPPPGPTDAGRGAGHREPPRLARLAGPDGGLARSAAELRRRASAATASPTSSCSAWADRASRPKCCARCSASRRGGRVSTCSTRPTRPRSGRRRRRPSGRSTSWRASRARRSSRTRSPPTSGTASRTPASSAGPITSSRSPTKGRCSSSARAREGFRDVFINPSDIGGRYSALSFFGLVPAALMGQNVPAMVGWGLAMLAASEPGFGDARSQPAVGLGLRSAPRRARDATS